MRMRVWVLWGVVGDIEMDLRFKVVHIGDFILENRGPGEGFGVRVSVLSWSNTGKRSAELSKTGCEGGKGCRISGSRIRVEGSGRAERLGFIVTNLWAKEARVVQEWMKGALCNTDS